MNVQEYSDEAARQGYAQAYQIISELRDRLEKQKAEFETELEEGYQEAYQLLKEVREKANQMREHILAMVTAGFDVGYNAVLTIFPVNNQFQVEIYDPLDDDTGEPFHNTLKGFTMTMHRHGDRMERMFDSAEEAVDFYLAVHQWLTQSPKQ